MDTQKLLVVGATGSCGRFFVGHALDAGFQVRCMVRDVKRITEENFEWAQHPALELYEGQTSDADAVSTACADVSAVVCMIGPPRGAKQSPLGDAVRHIAAGMRAANVRRLIVQAGGFVKLEGKPSLLEKIFRRLFILATNEAAMLAGNDEMAAFLVQECSDLDWTITRPGMLDERPASAAVEADHNYGPGMPKGKVGKVDLTRWYIELLKDERSYQKAPAPRYVLGSSS